jgi:hopene-associated glycosyltransferase HpnB
LARGWSGKVWALQQGVEVAQSFAPDFFLLTDADIEHAPQNVARLLAIAEEGKYSLASFMVKLQCQTLAERLLIPAFVFFFFMLYPPHWVQDPRRSIAGAAGGCILTRPDVLAKAGGLAAIRGEIIDDCSLAGAVKRSGGTVWLGLANTAVSIRPYRSFGEIARMISRTAFNQLDHSVFLLIVAILGLLLVYVAPVVLLIMPGRSSMVFGGIAFAVMTLAYAPMVRYYGLNPLWALTLPVAAIFYMGATIRSAMRYWRGRGGDWKGRLQDHAHAD